MPDDYPYLENLTASDLVSILAEYVKADAATIEADRNFIEAVKTKLKTMRLPKCL